MKILDKYILGKYLTTFFFCLVLFTVVVVVVDMSEKADDFVRLKFSVWKIFTDYYIGFIPHLDAMLFPLFVFISVIFFTSKMADRSEVIAILSSGVSFRRFLYPYWIGSILLALILWVGYKDVLPKANTIWGNFLTKYIDSNGGDVDKKANRENVYFRVDSNTYAGFKRYDTTMKQGYGFFAQKFEHEKLVDNLRANSIMWDEGTKKWKVIGAVERVITGDKERVFSIDSKLMSYNFKPVDLKVDDYFKDRLTTSELREFIKSQKMRGFESVKPLMVELYNRDAIPVSVIILTMIAAVLSSQKIRGGSGFHLGLGAILSVLYILFSRLSEVFAEKGNFTPALAAWTPNIIFGILAYYLYRRAPK